MHAGTQRTVRHIKRLFVVVVTVLLPLACLDNNTGCDRISHTDTRMNTNEAAGSKSW